jgi:hypothetical protein
VQRAGATGDSAPVASSAGPATRVADPQVQKARAQQVPRTGAQPPIIDLPPIEGAPEVQVPNLTPKPDDLPPNIQPLPDQDGAITVPALPDRPPPEPPVVPIMPGSQRITRISSRSGRPYEMRVLPTTPEGVETWIIRGGINMVTQAPRFGTIDIEADEAVIWKGPKLAKGEPLQGTNGEMWVDDAREPMEVYLEGNVILRQDENKFAGKSDQRTIRSPQLYFDFLTDRMLAPNAQIDMFAASLSSPITITSPRIEQFRPPVQLPNGTFTLSEHPEIRAQSTMMTGSRFPNPGYQLTSSSIDLTQFSRPKTNSNPDNAVTDPDAQPPQENVWRMDARQNIYWGGPIPMFYLPHVVQDIDDQQPLLRMIGFNQNNYFGYQFKTDWNGFRLFGQRKPKFIDVWNIDIDYLSARTKQFPAVGSEMGWFGNDLIHDLMDPYHKGPKPD